VRQAHARAVGADQRLVSAAAVTDVAAIGLQRVEDHLADVGKPRGHGLVCGNTDLRAHDDRAVPGIAIARGRGGAVRARAIVAAREHVERERDFERMVDLARLEIRLSMRRR
jgi:hypothetical protein